MASKKEEEERKKRIIPLLFFGGAAVVTGLILASRSATATPACMGNPDCSYPNEVCVGGNCVACSSDPECDPGDVCVGGVCQPMVMCPPNNMTIFGPLLMTPVPDCSASVDVRAGWQNNNPVGCAGESACLRVRWEDSGGATIATSAPTCISLVGGQFVGPIVFSVALPTAPNPSYQAIPIFELATDVTFLTIIDSDSSIGFLTINCAAPPACVRNPPVPCATGLVTAGPYSCGQVIRVEGSALNNDTPPCGTSNYYVRTVFKDAAMVVQETSPSVLVAGVGPLGCGPLRNMDTTMSIIAGGFGRDIYVQVARDAAMTIDFSELFLASIVVGPAGCAAPTGDLLIQSSSGLDFVYDIYDDMNCGGSGGMPVAGGPFMTSGGTNTHFGLATGTYSAIILDSCFVENGNCTPNIVVVAGPNMQMVTTTATDTQSLVSPFISMASPGPNYGCSETITTTADVNNDNCAGKALTARTVYTHSTTPALDFISNVVPINFVGAGIMTTPNMDADASGTGASGLETYDVTIELYDVAFLESSISLGNIQIDCTPPPAVSLVPFSCSWAQLGQLGVAMWTQQSLLWSIQIQNPQATPQNVFLRMNIGGNVSDPFPYTVPAGGMLDLGAANDWFGTQPSTMGTYITPSTFGVPGGSHDFDIELLDAGMSIIDTQYCFTAIINAGSPPSTWITDPGIDASRVEIDFLSCGRDAVFCDPESGAGCPEMCGAVPCGSRDTSVDVDLTNSSLKPQMISQIMRFFNPVEGTYSEATNIRLMLAGATNSFNNQLNCPNTAGNNTTLNILVYGSGDPPAGTIRTKSYPNSILGF